MKKFLSLIITMVLCLPLLVNAADKEKVKVYIFEAGGCPACAAQIEYLKGLEGYNKTFEIVEKELYVDHVDWAIGADYELGVKVANAFVEAGYDEDDINVGGTPMVIVSDFYGLTSYNGQLEAVINQAYEEGDRDAVGCIEKGGTDCVRSIIEKPKDYSMLIIVSALVSTIVILGTYLVKSTIDKDKIIEAINSKKK